MITLGVECTAHTLGIGIVENSKVLSNIHDIYRPPKGEGILPRNAADHHAGVFSRILKENLKFANLKMANVDLIAFSQGPGIGAPLSGGIAGAKYLASRFNKKIIGVNHPYAHVKITEHFTNLKDSLVVYVSGGNTQILVQEGNFYKVLGETLDIGIGNLFDSFARALKIEYAHGSSLEKLAGTGKYIELPYTVKGMNLVFSGLLTQSEKLIPKCSKKDLAYSIMQTGFAMTCEAAERALFLTKKKSIVVCGGVAQNRTLQSMLKTMADEDGVKFGVAADEFNRDNGAMIAYAGQVLYNKFGSKPIGFWKPDTGYRIDLMDKMLVF